MAEPSARSGVRGLSSFQVRFRTLENSWAPTPILRHDANDKAAGKRPLIEGWETYAQFGADPPTEADLTTWSRIRRAPGTGIATGNVVAIDLDFLCFPDLAKRASDITVGICGETPFVRQGQAPKIALVYRAAEPIESIRLKATNGSGDGVDILGEGAQLVAFGIHPGTRELYLWLGAESPLTATPDAAPAITNAQIRAVLAELGRFVVLASDAKSRGRGPRRAANGHAPAGGLGAIVRNAAGLVVDGREIWLTQTVHRTALAMAADGPVRPADLARHSWAEFETTTELSDGRWTQREVNQKAKAIVRRAKAGKVPGLEPKEPLRPEEPTYPDRSRPVGQARPAVEQAIRSFFGAADSYRAGQAAPTAGTPIPPVRAVRIGTGVGKTSIAARMIAERVKAGSDRPFLYCVPTHRLGDNIADAFTRHGIAAKAFRGRSARDPDRPGRTMCDDLAAVEIALNLGAVVETSCCKGKHPDTKKTVACPFHSSCSYQRQKASKPQVWIVAHEMLFMAQAALGPVSAIFVDEGFWQSGIWKSQRGLTLDEIGAPLPLATGPGRHRKDENASDVESYRQRLFRALSRQREPGGVRRQHLAAEGLTAETCTAAIASEWRLKPEAGIWPGMPAEARRAAAETSRGAKHVQAFARVWAAARTLLDNEGAEAVSGRMWLETSERDEGVARTVRTRGVKAIAAQWDAPTFIMDATLPDPVILRAFHPQVEILDDIDVTMPHVMVRQVLGAPVARKKLFNGRGPAGAGGKGNLRKLRWTILRRWIETGRQPTLVICQQAVEEWLKGSGLPKAIAVEHFNNMAGLDQYRDVRLLITIGRTQPDPAAHEADAGALTGLEPIKASAKANGSRWFDRIERGIRMADGSVRTVLCDRHPDPVAEACRWQVCEGELMQALGRGRGVNRTSANPLDIDILADVVLPVTVAEAIAWSDTDAGEGIEMAAEGIVLASPADMAKCWPELWATPKAAECAVADFPLHSLVRNILTRVWRGKSPPWSDATYRPPGRGQQTRRAAFDLSIVPDPRAWLEARLGPLAHFAAAVLRFEAEACEPVAERPPPPEAVRSTADVPPPPPREDPVMVDDDRPSLRDLWRKPRPTPPPEAEPRYRLRGRCQPSAARFECLSCDLAPPSPIETGGVIGRWPTPRRCPPPVWHFDAR